MALNMNLFARRRGGDADGQDLAVHANAANELLVAQGLPKYVEVTRKYDLFATMNTSAAAALVVRPSTVSNFTLYNGESSGGKLYIIDRMWAFNLVSTAAEARSGMWFCVHPTGMTAPTNDITARSSLRGTDGTLATNSIFDNGATVVADGWFPAGNFSTVEPTGVLPGAIMEFNFEGRVILPPTAAISGQVVSSVTGNTFTMGISWWEVPASALPLS